MTHRNIDDARVLLAQLGFPRGQVNDRSALTLLALANVGPTRRLNQATSPLLGITPIMDWVAENYRIRYAPNSRETFRRQTMHQFRDAGLVRYNPDALDRPVNSPAAAYQLAPEALDLLISFSSEEFDDKLVRYLASKPGLAARYAQERIVHRVPVRLHDGSLLSLSSGEHSDLIKAVVEQFAAIFAPGSRLVYAGDTGSKFGHFDAALLRSLGVQLDEHGKMPDVVLYYPDREWLLLVEAVTSHGPVDGKRHSELVKLFGKSTAGLVYVTAFPNRLVMGRYLTEIAWETEVWVADAPTHLIHFNGDRFLGPYAN